MILAFFACIPFLLPHQNKGSIKSLENYNKFDQSQVPVVFTHISDVHIDHINSNPAYYFNKTIDLITNVIKPEFNVITGDLANNFPGSHIPIYGRQQPSDIKMYTAYSEPLKNAFPVFEVDGNHDVFGIYDYQTKHNQSDYYKSQSLSQYQLSVYSYLIHNRNYTFIGLNPFDFPSPHPPLLYNARPTKELLDQLEKTVQTVKEENQNDVEIVIFNHFHILNGNLARGLQLAKISIRSSKSQTFLSSWTAIFIQTSRSSCTTTVFWRSLDVTC